MSKKEDEFVNVSIRIRNKNDIALPCLRVISSQPPVLFMSDRGQTYHFDNIFTEEHSQEFIYSETVKPLVEQVKTGYNCTIFAYGQTGTGKSYTIGTNAEERNSETEGLIFRCLKDFFSTQTESEEFSTTEISISFIEIYNEKVFDLLNDDAKLPLAVKGFNVQGITKISVDDIDKALYYLEKGGKKRRTGETNQNAKSSRSHAVFTIHYQSQNSEKEISAKLNLVDLAGLESVKKTGNQGHSFQEGVNINKGLLSLGQVMIALSTGANHIPYRQSIITTILQDSLNKKNYISLIACVSSSSRDSGETLHTLEFATRVKRMRNKPEVNQIITLYKKENPSLFMNNRNTPIKNNLYETPFKKPKIHHLNPLHESSNYSQGDMNFSSTLSSISQSESVNTHNFSPVIKKYMQQMEDNLMNKLETVIKSTIQRPTRRSSRLSKENCTPDLPWNRIREKIEDLVKTEIMKSNRITRATSSPIFDEQSVPAARKLFSPVNDDLNEISPKKEEEKDNFTPLNDSILFKKPSIVPSRPPVRRSMRLQLKPTVTTPEEITKVELNSTVRKRNYKRRTNCNSSTVEGSPEKKRSKVITAHTKEVLRILNNGTVKEVQKLHTIGPKKAEKIIFYRKLKGSFKAISDLAEMPQWSESTYDRFLVQNFLK